MIVDFLAPVPESVLEGFEECHPQQLYSHLHIHREIEGLPDLKKIRLAIIGVMEDRGALANKGCDIGADNIRKYLYNLYIGRWEMPLGDLGNIYKGETLEDSLFALKEVISELLRMNIIPIVIGGSQDLTFAMYRAYDVLEQTVNLTAVDSRFDLGQQGEQLHAQNYLSHIVLKKPYNLYHYANIGYQTYFVNQEELDLMERMFFDVVRLGNLRHSIEECEPYLRNADLVSIDLGVVRQHDAPATAYPSPNGFTGEEACAVARYAGLSDKVTSFGIFEYNPNLDFGNQTAHLAAQMIWYFLEGYSHRKQDYPFSPKKEHIKFTVLIAEGDHEITFYKSPKSDRWWVEVPINTKQSNRHTLVPCSHNDYLAALKGEIPMRWWRAYQKGM
jgi:arginase family enzyme